MKKLRLEIDQVRVDSFNTVDEDAPGGSVLVMDLIITATFRCGSCPAVSCAPCP